MESSNVAESPASREGDQASYFYVVWPEETVTTASALGTGGEAWGSSPQRAALSQHLNNSHSNGHSHAVHRQSGLNGVNGQTQPSRQNGHNGVNGQNSERKEHVELQHQQNHHEHQQNQHHQQLHQHLHTQQRQVSKGDSPQPVEVEIPSNSPSVSSSSSMPSHSHAHTHSSPSASVALALSSSRVVNVPVTARPQVSFAAAVQASQRFSPAALSPERVSPGFTGATGASRNNGHGIHNSPVHTSSDSNTAVSSQPSSPPNTHVSPPNTANIHVHAGNLSNSISRPGRLGLGGGGGGGVVGGVSGEVLHHAAERLSMDHEFSMSPRKRPKLQHYDLNGCLECEVKDAEIQTLRRRIHVMEQVVTLLNQKMNSIQQNSNMLFSQMVMPASLVSPVVIPTSVKSHLGSNAAVSHHEMNGSASNPPSISPRLSDNEDGGSEHAGIAYAQPELCPDSEHKVELIPGTGIYMSLAKREEAKREAKNGTQLARKLMDSFWDRDTLARSSLSSKSKFQYQQLDPKVINAIEVFCLAFDANTHSRDLHACMTDKCCQARSRRGSYKVN